MPLPDLKIHQLVYVDTHLAEGNALVVKGWGKVLTGDDECVCLEIASGLVGDDFAECDGVMTFADDPDWQPHCVTVPRDDVFTTDEVAFGNEPKGRPEHKEV